MNQKVEALTLSDAIAKIIEIVDEEFPASITPCKSVHCLFQEPMMPIIRPFLTADGKEAEKKVWDVLERMADGEEFDAIKNAAFRWLASQEIVALVVGLAAGMRLARMPKQETHSTLQRIFRHFEPEETGGNR